ncbi:tRNA-specific adenosine deaminase 1 [Hypsibius exemplaris]|uniref:tRNA-specific adenosine deaminase 1 n=1 Tax=Hypsibius exemplaris TaxID=2072580 RepID=A0A1W0WZQ9_HYPEX|nr:tRNA-specific adenosine deaminase 1 [Hypsibius exemplaris]
MASSSDRLVKLAFSSFSNLMVRQPTLTPAAHEWTNFAAIVATFPASVSPNQTQGKSDNPLLTSSESVALDDGSVVQEGFSTPPQKMETICMATGTKCLSASAMSERGDLVHDSHAEVLARRCLMRFFYQECLNSIRGSSDFLDFGGSHGIHRFTVKRGIGFHLVVSHTPCGDASIFPVQPEDRQVIEKRKKVDGPEEFSPKRQKTATSIHEDTHRTGAKCVPNATACDSYLSGKDYHIIGALRTKPGRGHPTLSMSCSDKMMKWNVLGLQGALLSDFLGPIYLVSLCIAKCPFNFASIRQSLVGRSEKFSFSTGGFRRHAPVISQSDLIFSHGKHQADLDVTTQKSTCHKSILWIRNGDSSSSVEVIINGKKQGATGKSKLSPSSRSMVCKMELFLLYEQLADRLQSMLSNHSPRLQQERTSYAFAKRKNVSYSSCREDFAAAFPEWTRKPSKLLEFSTTTTDTETTVD